MICVNLPLVSVDIRYLLYIALLCNTFFAILNDFVFFPTNNFVCLHGSHVLLAKKTAGW